jgi:hypothetical protein
MIAGILVLVGLLFLGAGSVGSVEIALWFAMVAGWVVLWGRSRKRTSS